MTIADRHGGGAPRHSVVVPTYQRRDLVVETVRALMAQEVPPLEVIVVVDGSTDGTADALRRLHAPFSLVVLEQPNRGLAQARNRGAAAARGDLLLFLDDDMLAAPDLLVRVRAAHDRGADAVTGHIPTAPGTEMFRLPGAVDWAEQRRERLLAAEGPLPVGDVLGGQLSVRREVFDALGGFDDRRFTVGGSYGGEDGDFARRLIAGGHRVVFTGCGQPPGQRGDTPHLPQELVPDGRLRRRLPAQAPRRARRDHAQQTARRAVEPTA